MSEVVSLELLLDDALESRVRAGWEALAAAGLPSLASHTASSNRPHITLLVRSSLADFDARDLVDVLPIPIVLGAPVVFGDGEKRVLARSVVPSPQLIAWHSALHARVEPGDDAAHTSPGSWTPHVTLARRVRMDDIGRALGLVDGEWHGEATAMRRFDAASRTVTALH